MTSLIIDTSTQVNFLALIHENETVGVRKIFARPQASRFLLPAIQDLLNQSGLLLKDLQCVSVGNGPGAFTGTRMGVVIAKSLAFALRTPLVSFCSLESFMPEERESPFYILADAKAKGLYYIKGCRFSGEIHIDPPKFALIEDFVENIAAGSALFSPDADFFREKLPVEVQDADFNLKHLSCLTRKKFQKKRYEDPLQLNAVYLRSP
ncbi:MAG: hypothetical protein Tsb0015_02970 [Simkaniaceae bacterium]